MVYNGDANEQDIVSDIDFWCSTNNNTYPINDKTRNANFALARISAKIMRFDRQWKHLSSNLSTIPVATKSISAGQDNVTIETKHLKILRFRILDKNSEWITLEAKDRNSLSDDVLNSTGQPEYYDKLGFSLMPLPVPDYATTAEIEYQPGAAEDLFDVTDTDKEPGFNPDFHRLVSLYASEDYCNLHARDRLPAIRDKIAEIEADMIEYFEDRDIDGAPHIDVKRTSCGPSLLQ